MKEAVVLVRRDLQRHGQFMEKGMERKPLRVLVLGGSGMLGHKVFETLRERFDVCATFRDADGAWAEFPMYADKSRAVAGVDAMEFESVARAVREAGPDAVVNCIGVVKQVRAAHEPVPCISINALFPHRLAELCREVGARLIHMSTDCVFSGRRGRYTEDDPSDAEDLYGKTKSLGEVGGPGALTIRSSIIGRDFRRDTGLVEWFLSNRGGRVKGFRRAIYTGLTTRAMSEMIGRVIADFPDLSGLWHVASEPINKYDLLVRLRDTFDLDICVEPEDSFFCDRSLDGSRFAEKTGLRTPGWDEMILGLASESALYDDWRLQHGPL